MTNNLCYAIVLLAAEDYLTALRAERDYEHATDNYRKYLFNKAAYTIADCETFFRKDIGWFMDIDGEWLMRVIREKSYDRGFYFKRENF